MFRRNSSTKQTADLEPTDAAPRPQELPGGKGRPTPSRREAEAARKVKLGQLPLDPKERKRAERDANRAGFQRSRTALRSGDEANYPARDRGEAKAFVRDYVDGRVRLLEMLMPLVILCWLTLVLHSTKIYVVASVVMEVVVVVGLALGLFLGTRVKRAVGARFGEAEVRGTGFYAFSRAVMPRFLRQPKPRLTMTGKPRLR